MNFILLSAIFVVLPAGLLTHPSTTTGIRGYEGKPYFGPNVDGGYNYELKTDDQERQETRDANGTVTGSYSFISPDGTQQVVNYVADESGYRTIKNKYDSSATSKNTNASTDYTLGTEE